MKRVIRTDTLEAGTLKGRRRKIRQVRRLRRN